MATPISITRGYRRLARSFPEERKKRLTRSAPSGQKKQEAPDQRPQPPILARQAKFLFLRRPEERSAEEQETLAQLRSLHPEVDQAYQLVQQFAHMLRTRTGEQLNDWLCRVKASKIRELQGFLTGVNRDKAAVTAGLTLPHNNGVVEGKVNKLKLIKRMGYGRAELHVIRNTPTSFPMIRMIRWKGKVFCSGKHSLGVLSLCSGESACEELARDPVKARSGEQYDTSLRSWSQ